jgi:hypothetical protein
MKIGNIQTSKIAATLLLAGYTVFSFSAFGQGKSSETKTVKGEVLDMACYMDHGAHGEKHAECAKTCLKKGSPVGLLADNGQVYLLVEDHGSPDAYAKVRKEGAEKVTVTGKYNNRNGVQALVVEDVK